MTLPPAVCQYMYHMQFGDTDNSWLGYQAEASSH